MARYEQSAFTEGSASILLPRASAEGIPRRHREKPGTFTKAALRQMQCPSGQAEKLFWDAACRGFGLRALQSGRRSWVYQYRDLHGRTRRVALGDVSAVSLDVAREEA